MNPLLAFLILLKGSLFSFSGMGNLPIIHDDLIGRGWAGERQFAESLAIGQITPGPNGLWVISLGYLMDGFRGAVLALIAITIPPMIIIAVDRVYRRVADHAAMEGFVRGLSLSTAGIFVVVLLGLLRTTGMDTRAVAIAVVSTGLAMNRRIPLILVIGLGALAGILLYGGTGSAR